MKEELEIKEPYEKPEMQTEEIEIGVYGVYPVDGTPVGVPNCIHT